MAASDVVQAYSKNHLPRSLQSAIRVALCAVSMASVETPRLLHADTLQELLAQEWEYELREDPQLATAVGDRRYNNAWKDYSVSAVDKQRQALTDWLRLFDQVNPKTLVCSKSVADSRKPRS
jgi:uncharacterized protein (DUF885 family)